MKRLLLLAIVAIVFCVIPPQTAKVTGCGGGSGTCFFIGTGNFSTTSNWSDSSGGVSCTCAPTTGDAAILDGVGSNNNSTIAASISLRSFDSQGYTGTTTLSTGQTLTISGNDAGSGTGVAFRIGSGAGFTATSTTTSIVQFTSTSGTITVTANSSGATRNLGNTTINGAGGTFVLGAALTTNAASTFAYTAGTDFQLAGFALSVGLLDLSATNVRTLTCGASTTTHTVVAGLVVNTTTNANLTVSCASATHVISAVPTGSRSLGFGTSGTKNWGAIQITNAAANAFRVLMNGTMSAASLTTTNLRFLQFASTQTYTFSGAISHSGTVSNPALFIGDGTSASTNIVVGSNSTLDYVYIQNINKSGGAGSLTADHYLDGGSNAGVTLATPFGGGSGGGWIGNGAL